MFEVNIDEYLDEETEAVKRSMDAICKNWETSVSTLSVDSMLTSQLGTNSSTPSVHNAAPTFLNASNPDQVKKNVLAGFRDVLLLPVTIVPRTVTYGVNALVSGSSQAVSGLSMLNPQKWGGSNGTVQRTQPEKADVIFEEKEVMDEKSRLDSLSVPQSVDLSTSSRSGTRPVTPLGPDGKSFDRMQLLVSLDTALELIHADRDSLKRAETFANYPGKAGHRVREAIEEIFVLLLKAVGDRHIAPGFRV